MKRMILMLGLMLIAGTARAGGPLDLGGATDWFYEEVKKHGVIGTLVDWNGKKTIAGALNFGVIHNKAKTRYWAGIAVGADVTADKVMKGRVLASPSINLIDISKAIFEARRLRDHVTVIQPPSDWQLWVGPWIRTPANTWGEWTWKSHTGPIFASLGKKVGGKAPKDFKVED